MPHFKIDPRRELEFLSGRMRKFIDEFPDTLSVEFGTRFEPRVDVISSPDAVRVLVELPGVAKGDIRVELKDDVLDIAGSKRMPAGGDGEQTMHTQERAYGEFSRRITLPCEVQASGVQAAFSDGVLTITLPRKAAAPESNVTISIQ